MFLKPHVFPCPHSLTCRAPRYLRHPTAFHPCLYSPSFSHVRIFQSQVHASSCQPRALPVLKPIGLEIPAPFTGLRACDHNQISIVPNTTTFLSVLPWATFLTPSPAATRSRDATIALTVLPLDPTLNSSILSLMTSLCMTSVFTCILDLHFHSKSVV